MVNRSSLVTDVFEHRKYDIKPNLYVLVCWISETSRLRPVLERHIEGPDQPSGGLHARDASVSNFARHDLSPWRDAVKLRLLDVVAGDNARNMGAMRTAWCWDGEYK